MHVYLKADPFAFRTLEISTTTLQHQQQYSTMRPTLHVLPRKSSGGAADASAEGTSAPRDGINAFVRFLDEFKYPEGLVNHVKSNIKKYYDIRHEITIVYDINTLKPVRTAFYGIV